MFIRVEDLIMEKEMKSNNNKRMHHFILVHGLGQGAWCWYKVKTMLESAGHQVTALDLAASGINHKKLNKVDTMWEYSRPVIEFMETISTENRVILVGHSLGGLNIAYAMDKFPNKISVAVDKFLESAPKERFSGTQFSFEGDPGKLKTTMLFGPKFLSSIAYQLSPAEDMLLATMLTRTGSMFLEDLSTAAKFSNTGYGSIELTSSAMMI
ncbi:hypothetical protein IFM89_032066 [Coptis chinensis]|uniref:AB hydrolase-1 domain-containing protein n=1 Tax=Coptis chinensis TaxID=261450 RepID=A0A835I805_9MAGN|nr:hypothetical protein IFM89_032066 [Coptis chinensis]